MLLVVLENNASHRTLVFGRTTANGIALVLGLRREGGCVCTPVMKVAPVLLHTSTLYCRKKSNCRENCNDNSMCKSPAYQNGSTCIPDAITSSIVMHF